jgi:hypothetical protein
MAEPREGKTGVERHEHARRSIDDLLHEDIYTPAELATLLDIDVTTILNAAFRGDLKATIVQHDVVGITRQAALEWLK